MRCHASLQGGTGPGGPPRVEAGPCQVAQGVSGAAPDRHGLARLTAESWSGAPPCTVKRQRPQPSLHRQLGVRRGINTCKADVERRLLRCNCVPRANQPAPAPGPAPPARLVAVCVGQVAREHNAVGGGHQEVVQSAAQREGVGWWWGGAAERAVKRSLEDILEPREQRGRGGKCSECPATAPPMATAS